ncbi:MAG: DNA gyrase subunit B, partial [Pseudomonadota bacterium]
QMPQIIERGYLYIAQPPLYKLKRGSNETYLKDDAALEAYLVKTVLEEASLKLGNGQTLQNQELATFVKDAARVSGYIKVLSRRIPLHVIEAAVLVDLFNLDIDEEQAAAKIPLFSDKINQLSSDSSNWQAKLGKEGFIVSRTMRGVEEVYVLDEKICTSREAKELHVRAANIIEAYSGELTFARKGTEVKITTPSTFYDSIMEIGKKGTTINRFKGLGEMNPEQLWDTTLNPETRTLLRVEVKHAEDAEEVFSTLMGDVVEPRRDFIVSNALSVANLDV